MDENSLFQTIPKMPSELSGPVPRRIRFSDSSRLLPFVLAALIGLTFIAGILYSVYAVGQVQRRSALRRNGVDAEAKITFLGRVGKGGYVVRYTFTTVDGPVSDKAEVPSELVSSLEGSTTTTIRYLPSNPAINHPATWEWSLLSEWPMIFVLIGFLTVGAVPSAMLHRQRNVLALGKPVPGVCRKMSRGGQGINFR